MKKLFFLLACVLFLCGGCSKENDDEEIFTKCGTYNGNTLYKGSKGGCYYINSNGNKTYVDRSNCNC